MKKKEHSNEDSISSYFKSPYGTTMEEFNKLLFEMKNGNHDTIISCLFDESPILNYWAIITGTNEGMRDKKFIKGLKRLTQSKINLVYELKLEDFAIAALDVLNVERYIGEDEIIKDYIDAKLNIL